MLKFSMAAGILLSFALSAKANINHQAPIGETTQNLDVEILSDEWSAALDAIEAQCAGCTEEELQIAYDELFAKYERIHVADRRVIASWYGGGEKLNKHTANGEVFNPGAMTAAMRTCPFGTKVRVTNPANGKSVVVRINDRGPAKSTGASIDLSRAAARKIGINKGPVIISDC